MKRKYGPSIQTKQVHALHRIAFMLHTEEPVIDVNSTDLSMISVFEARRVRLVPPVHRHLTGRDTAINVDIPQARKNEHGTKNAHSASQPHKGKCYKPGIADAKHSDCDNAGPAVPDIEPRPEAHAANTGSNVDQSDATQVATPLAPPAAGQWGHSEP
jgi:hypothetical protein